MRYPLWISPTGYRRTGTRLKELRNLFEIGITARAILEPLLSCDSEANAIEVAKILLDKDFDVAGVQESPDGHVIGFVFRDSLKDGIVRNHLNKMTTEHRISDSTPLASLLSIFKTKEHVFVWVGQHVGGIITRADLGKPPMRTIYSG
jgi:predicted transcriptional regulator